MGLDMYLNKYPRGFNPDIVSAVEDFASWIKDGIEYSSKHGKKSSFEAWCGRTENDLPDASSIVKLLEMVHISYSAWDHNKGYAHEQIHDNVGYWRKANAIHNWFVENVQDGEDDCEYHRPVTKEDLETLFELCREVLADHSKANELLPNRQGFFFGSYEYDEWYFKDIQYTADLCEQLIRDFDFENYNLYYCSSW